MARKQERKFTSFNLEKSPMVEENERRLNASSTPQQEQTPEVVESAETAEPIAQQKVHVQPQSQQQPELQQQVQPQVQPEPQVQTQPEPQPQAQVQPQQQAQVQPQQQAQVQPQQQSQVQPQQQSQVQPQQQPITQPISSISSVGNRSKRTEQGITILVPMEYYEQIALMKMRTGIPIRDIALQAVIEFVDKRKND